MGRAEAQAVLTDGVVGKWNSLTAALVFCMDNERDMARDVPPPTRQRPRLWTEPE